MREIIVDNFAGGGGASTGIELAIGRSVDIAINHDENAIAMHKTNHPDTLHYCESVFDVDPVAATGGNPVGLAWFSPDCRHFSKAKGAKPVKKEIRGLAWIVLRWALAKRPRVMMLENVEEFKTWGPLLADEMRPDPARTGETFNAFVGMLSTGIPADHPALAEVCEFLSIERGSEQAQKLVDGLGYDVDYRELRACDYGAPTIRKRFFMVMRCDGCPIQWPAVTHGDPKSLEVQSGRLMPWRTAAECIDWNVPALSIFDRKKPLAENTLKRIARGIQRFVIESASPFIVKCNHTSSKNAYDAFRGQSLNEPLQTITKKLGYALAVPHLTKFRTGATGQPVTEPVPTVTADTSKRPGGNGHALGIVEAALTPFLAGNGGSEYQAKPRPLDKPAHTILKQSRACLVAPVIYGNEIPVTLNYYGFGGGEVLPAGVNITVASGVKGAGAPALNDAVAAMGDEPFDYIGLPFNDTASVNTMATEMNDSSGRWSYVRQLYGHVYTAKTGTLSELVAAGDQFNLQHITLAGYEKDTQTPADELAASRTARAAVFIRNDPARPTQTGELVDMLPAPKGKRFTTTEQQTLLSHGVATAYVESGVLRIQRDITTYRKNAYGVADNSYLDSETLHTSAYVLRRLKSVITSKYGRHKLANDGTRFGSGQAIVTPAVIRGELGSTYRQMEREGIVENFDLFQQHLIVERNANNSNRLDVLFPPDYVNQLRVFAVLNQFRLQYSEEAA